MLIVETSGSWRDMGAAYARVVGEAVLGILRNDMQPLLAGEVPPQAAEIHRRVVEHAPHLLEETQGMSDVLGIAPDALLCYRLSNDVRALGPLTRDCSCVAIRDAAEGPLLARTCDIEIRNHPHQELRITRPDKGMATIIAGYAGWVNTIGFNSAGVGNIGGSVKPKTTYDKPGIGSQMLGHLMLYTCTSTRQATDLYARNVVNGKGAVEIIGDATGDICGIDTVSGAASRLTPLAADCNEMFTPNFYFNRDIAIEKSVKNWYNSYARYGVIAQQLQLNPAARSLAGAQQLMRDVAQPGPYIPEGAMSLSTAYATVFDLRSRTCHISRGNPNQAPFEAFSIESMDK